MVWANYASGGTLAQKEIGPVNASRAVNFDRPPCYWDIKADGNWSLTSR